MLVFLDVYSTNVKFIKKDRVDIILKNLKTMITDDHQYNLMLFEHIFGFKLLDDVSLMNQFINTKHLSYKDMICYDVYLDLYNLNKTNEKSNFEWYSLIAYTNANLADILFAEYRRSCTINKIFKNNKRNWYVFVYN